MKTSGSEWRQWDLHFHTPSSYDYQCRACTNEDIIARIRAEGLAVVAITDHHIIDVKRIRELQALAKPHGITILPGIEFLSDARGDDPIHFIGIFSEKTDLEFLWGQLKHKTNLSEIVKKGKHYNEVYCRLDETFELIRELNGVISIHAGQKHGSIEGITNALPHTMAQKQDIAKFVDLFELGKESDQQGYRQKVFPVIGTIPMIICSDNHDIRNYSRKAKLWIKGDPSFEGLQYAINEPNTRFHIGSEPDVLKRFRQNKTKFISFLKIECINKSDPSNRWFEQVEIPLNGELVSIIGNKGSGKSAIADIIGICADADHQSNFQFLNRERFVKRGLAERFEAEIVFASGAASDKRRLDYVIPSSTQRRVKYIPQAYFETVCNEIGKAKEFRKEIEKVVFQYIPAADRLGQSSFQDLIKYKTESISVELQSLARKLDEINRSIILLEDKSSPARLAMLKSSLTTKQEELEVHLALKPKPVAPPEFNDPDSPSGQIYRLLETWAEKRKKLQAQHNEFIESLTIQKISQTQIEGLRKSLEGLQDFVDATIQDNEHHFKSFGINPNEVISCWVDFSPIDRALENTVKKIKEIEGEIFPTPKPDALEYEALSLFHKVELCEREIESLQQQVSSEQREYQDYIQANIDWDLIKDGLEGDENSPDTINWLKKEIQYAESKLEQDIRVERGRRLEVTAEIFKKKNEVMEIYNKTKEMISVVLDGQQVPGLTIDSCFSPTSDFADDALAQIAQNRIGSFYGSEDARRLFNNSIFPSDLNWGQIPDISSALNSLIEHLEFDKRPNAKSASRTFIGDTVRDRLKLYNYLFSLEFLNVHYELKQNGKNLEQLSPGEKGALLLVFYLVLDQEDIPLVIDQPEDNLDNFSIAKYLVPFISKAKTRRQIIMVTHNPNLAVVADSEQVINVKISKETGNYFDYVSGGIENAVIRDEIVRVLEGDKPAFQTRKNKYGDFEIDD